MATILVVDDDAGNRQFLTDLLRGEGHRMLVASDGAKALELVRAEHPDVVVSDILMPTMDGFEFVRGLRADPAIRNTPVIFCTATFDKSQVSDLAQACGVRHVLEKPSRPATILRAVNEALGQGPTRARPISSEQFYRQHEHLIAARFAEKLEAAGARLATLIHHGLELSREQDSRRLLENFCGAAREIVGAEIAMVGLVEEKGHPPDEVIAKGVGPEVAAIIVSSPPWRDLLDRTLTELRPVRLRPARQDRDVRDQSIQASPPAFLGIPLISPTRVYGWVCLQGKIAAGEFDEADERVALTLAAQLAVAFENAKRYDDVRRYTERLEEEVAERERVEEELRRNAKLLHVLSRRLIEAQETERRRIAHELHDEVGQNLTLVKINLHNSRRHAEPAARESHLADAIGLVEHTLQQIRSLSLDLRPALLDSLGLGVALRWYLDRQSQQSGVAIQLDADPPDFRAPPELEIICFRVVQEAVTNILRHAQASQVQVKLLQDSHSLQLDIRDNGIGFDVPAARERAARGTSLGLVGMQERVWTAGGNVDIKSESGQGTSIRVLFPWPWPATGQS